MQDFFTGKTNSDNAKSRRNAYSQRRSSFADSMFSKDAPKIRADILNSIPLTPPIVSKIHNHSSPINSSVSCSSVDKTGDFFECFCFFLLMFSTLELMFQSNFFFESYLFLHDLNHKTYSGTLSTEESIGQMSSPKTRTRAFANRQQTSFADSTFGQSNALNVKTGDALKLRRRSQVLNAIPLNTLTVPSCYSNTSLESDGE